MSDRPSATELPRRVDRPVVTELHTGQVSHLGFLAVVLFGNRRGTPAAVVRMGEEVRG
jgi:hypothetical protein